MPLLIAAAALAFDFAALDAAIARCDRAAVMPVFAAEGGRRSAAATEAYAEQAAIVAGRAALAAQKPTLRAEDYMLAWTQLDHRQRALDDRQRLEALRQATVDLKRGFYLTSCVQGRKSASD